MALNLGGYGSTPSVKKRNPKNLIVCIKRSTFVVAPTTASRIAVAKHSVGALGDPAYSTAVLVSNYIMQ